MKIKLPSFAPPPTPIVKRSVVNALLIVGIVVAAPHLARTPAWMPVLLVSSGIWRYLCANHGWRQPPTWLRIVLMLLVVGLVLNSYGTTFGRDAGVSFLLALVGLKLTELRQPRDYHVTLFLLYFLILAQFLFTQEPWAGFWGAGAAVGVTLLLVELSGPRSEALLPTLKLIGRMSLKALPLVAIIYLLFPRIEGSLWALPSDSFSGRSGLDDEISPGAINDLRLDDTIAFRVEFDRDTPPQRDLYWRSLVFQDFDGTTWKRGYPAARKTEIELPNPEAVVDYSIILEPHDKTYLPILENPVGETDGQLFSRPDRTVRAKRPVRQRFVYRGSAAFDARLGLIGGYEKKRALQMPEAVDRRVRELAERWRNVSESDREIVQAALNHFREEEFFYTLKPPLLSNNAIDQFLFETRRGYCEHFASAFALLMRTAGIPTRVVGGYQGGELNTMGDYLVVRQSDAHAWTEVWLEDTGWTRIDPTAAVAPERIEYGLEALRRLADIDTPIGSVPLNAFDSVLSRSWLESVWVQGGYWLDNLNTTWHRWVMGFGPEEQRLLLEKLGLSNPNWPKMIFFLFLFVAVAMIGVALSTRTSSTRDPIQVVFLKFREKIRKLGVEAENHDGPTVLLQRIQKLEENQRVPATEFILLYIKHRYESAPRPRDISELKRYLRSV